MKFDCGETYTEYIKRKTNWHRWFAWYPVKVKDHDCRWLEFVERRWTNQEECCQYTDYPASYEYRAIKEYT